MARRVVPGAARRGPGGARMRGPVRAPVSVQTVELLRLHLIHQERRGNLASAIYARQNRIRSFARWLEPRELFDATRNDIETFLDGRKTKEGRRITTTTRYSWISHLHAFYLWAVNDGLIALDPTLAVVRPKIRSTLPRPINDDDLTAALSVAGPQMRAMLSLAAYAGLRCQEIAGMDREDVLEGMGLIRVVHGKGAKERIVPLHPELLAALRCLPMPRSGALFTRPQGGRHLPATMSATIGRYLRDLGIDATAHQLRHWFATNVYAAGHDIRVTQELLGHSNPSTTSRYVAFSAVAAEAAVKSLRL
jgi:site-specific recombinase XerD